MARVDQARQPLRILHMHGSFNLGGKEARAVRLMNAFGADARHVVLSADPMALAASMAIDPAVDAVIAPDRVPSLAGLPGVRRYRRLASYFRRFDLLLSYNWGAMDGVMAHCLFSHVMPLPPLIHHEDGFNEDERVRRKRKRDAFRMIALARAYAIVVPSATLATVAREGWRQPASRVVRIANGIPIDDYAPGRTGETAPLFVRREGEVVVGTLAGLRAVKNLPLMVRAVAAAGPGVRLVIVGEGPERDVILTAAAKHRIADRVVLAGFHPRPAEIIAQFDIFALSSDSEQFPISLLEAMAAGLPVAATAVGDVADMVSSVNMPYIVPAGDAAALASAIRTLAANPELRAAIGAANLARAQAEYNEAKMIARYRRLYGTAAGFEDLYATARR